MTGRIDRCPTCGQPCRWFRSCPKCGEPEPRVRFQPGQCFPFDREKSWRAEIVARHDGEHFHAECARCRFEWPAGMDGSYR